MFPYGIGSTLTASPSLYLATTSLRKLNACNPLPHAPPHTQVLFQDGKFQWKRLENLLALAKEGASGGRASNGPDAAGGLDLSDTAKDALRVLLLDDRLRTQVGWAWVRRCVFWGGGRGTTIHGGWSGWITRLKGEGCLHQFLEFLLGLNTSARGFGDCGPHRHTVGIPCQMVTGTAL